MSRHHRKAMAEETLRIVACGEYVPRPGSRVVISGSVSKAIGETRVYTPDELLALAERPPAAVNEHTTFEVRNETTLIAAQRLVVEQRRPRVLCLNFASANNPGGGFLSGSQAQEESLARSSALYASLTAAPRYYESNRACGTAMYTDHMILSPNVPVFRNDAGDLMDAPYEVTFVTAPAVNAGAIIQNESHRRDQIVPTMRRRVGMLLALAADENYRDLVLGAWGCGVFRNDHSLIAELFAEHLLGNGAFAGSFERVVFAVLDKSDGNTITPFRRAFDGVLKGA